MSRYIRAIVFVCTILATACGSSGTNRDTTGSGDATTSTIAAAPASPTAIAIKDGRIVELDVNTGQEFGSLYAGPRKAIAPVSVRRVEDKPVVFASVENPNAKCETPILQIANGSATELGIVGSQPTISPDGRFLAYVALGDTPAVSVGCPLSTLAVRDLTASSERRWTLPDGQGFGAMVWSPNGSQLYFQLIGEAFVGDLSVVDTATAPVGGLNAASTPVNIALQENEWIDRPRKVSEGVFVTVWCCKKPNEGLGTRESSTFGVLTSSGMRRITSPVPAQSVVAVDPLATTLIVYDVGTSALSTVRVDGTGKVKIGGQWFVTF